MRKTGLIFAMFVFMSTGTYAKPTDIFSTSIEKIESTEVLVYAQAPKLPALNPFQYYRVDSIQVVTEYQDGTFQTTCEISFMILDTLPGEYIPRDQHGSQMILLDDALTFIPYNEVMEELRSMTLDGICDLRNN